jgi:hypothetical protein
VSEQPRAGSSLSAPASGGRHPAGGRGSWPAPDYRPPGSPALGDDRGIALEIRPPIRACLIRSDQR